MAATQTAPTPVNAHGAPTPPRTTRELCTIAELDEPAMKLLGAADPPQRVFVAQLVEHKLFSDAARFIAFALPRREAVWWAWVCARKAAGGDPPPKVKTALEATEKWIVQPNEANRRAAMAAAEALGIGTPAGCAGLAAFMSTGSIAPPDTPAVPPPEHMTATAVSAGVTLSAVVVEPEKAPEKYADYIRMGLEVADRTKLWPV
jgi:hypothetical protein